MASHPPLDVRVHLVADVEDDDGADRLAKTHDDRLDHRMDLRKGGEQELERDREDHGRCDDVQEETNQVLRRPGRFEAELEAEGGEFDPGPPPRPGWARVRLKTSAGEPRGIHGAPLFRTVDSGSP